MNIQFQAILPSLIKFMPVPENISSRPVNGVAYAQQTGTCYGGREYMEFAVLTRHRKDTAHPAA
jgi:hypothetical protein